MRREKLVYGGAQHRRAQPVGQQHCGRGCHDAEHKALGGTVPGRASVSVVKVPEVVVHLPRKGSEHRRPS